MSRSFRAFVIAILMLLGGMVLYGWGSDPLRSRIFDVVFVGCLITLALDLAFSAHLRSIPLIMGLAGAVVTAGQWAALTVAVIGVGVYVFGSDSHTVPAVRRRLIFFVAAIVLGLLPGALVKLERFFESRRTLVQLGQETEERTNVQESTGDG
jgi:hypothetical protein